MDAIDNQIETGLQVLDKRESELIALVSLGALTIAGPEDHKGYKQVREARITIKNARVAVEKDAKALRENAVKFQKAVITREKELIAIVASAESNLEKEEDRYNEAVEQIRIAKEREENARIQARVDALAKFNYGLDLYEAKIMEEENFQALLGHAEAEYLKEQEALESKRLEDERIKREEEERLQREREELAKQRAEQEAREAEIRASREKLERDQKEREEFMRKQQEEKEAWLKADREKLEAERRQFQEQKEREELQKKLAEENRLFAEAEARREKERAERLEALKPDKEKLLAFAKHVADLVPPTIHDQEAGEVLGYAVAKLLHVKNYIIERTSNL